MEEKKAENELDMKREIKYLLEKWLQNSQGKGGSQLLNKSALMQGAVAQVQKAFSSSKQRKNKQQEEEEGEDIMTFEDEQQQLLMLQNYEEEEEGEGEGEGEGFIDNGGSNLITAQDNSYMMGRSFAGGKGGNNNTSIMGNFNPMTALETYENNNFGGGGGGFNNNNQNSNNGEYNTNSFN